MNKLSIIILALLASLSLSSCAMIDSFMSGFGQQNTSNIQASTAGVSTLSIYSDNRVQTTDPNTLANYYYPDYVTRPSTTEGTNTKPIYIYNSEVPITKPVSSVETIPAATTGTRIETRTAETDNIAQPIPRKPAFSQSIFAQSIFGPPKSQISITERNSVLEALTNYEWLSTNNNAITNKYTFRIDDNGLIVSFSQVGTEEKGPEYYLSESPRGYKLDFPALSAHLGFILSETGSLVKTVKIGNNVEDVYAMKLQARGEAYDDNIF